REWGVRGPGGRERAAVGVKASKPARFGVAEIVTTRSATEPASVRSTVDAAASVAEEATGVAVSRDGADSARTPATINKPPPTAASTAMRRAETMRAGRRIAGLCH